MKILSQGKFRNFDGFESMGLKPTLKIIFEGISIECTHDHKFLRDDNQWVEAQNISIGECYNEYKVLEVIRTNKEQEVFDAINVEDTHSFYAEGVTSHNCNFLYIDETAFVEGWEEFFASVFPTISSGETTKILFTSTPKGLNHFYKTSQGAKEGTNGYSYLEVPWWEVPGRDERWKEETLSAMDFNQEKFNQEFCCEFIGSSGTLIDGSKLKELVIKPAVSERANIKVYEPASQGRTYVCVADVSRGKGLDYSAFIIFDVTEMPYKTVCVYRDNMITPIDYAELIYQCTRRYNEAYTLIEINDIGGQVADILHHEFECDTLLHTESAGRSGKRISSGFTSTADRGIRTTKSVKSIGCNMMKMMVEQNQLITNDFDIINELSTFSRKGTSYEAESGCHDDLVMCMVLFSWLSDQTFFKEITDINTMSMLKQRNEDALMDALLPIGFNNYEDSVSTTEIIEVDNNAWLQL